MAMSFRFSFSERPGVVSALEVHEPDDSASIERLYGVLLAMRLQLVSACDLEIDGRAVLELAICELDGAPVKPARRRSILAELARHIASGDGTNGKPLRAA